MLKGVLILFYVAVSVFLILVVLLQTGKRADLAGAFGGGGSQTALGTRGAANLLTKLTTVSAVLFMVIALTLSIISSRGTRSGRSVLDEVPTPASSAPAVPPPVEGGPAQLPAAASGEDTTDQPGAAESPVETSEPAPAGGGNDDTP